MHKTLIKIENNGKIDLVLQFYRCYFLERSISWLHRFQMGFFFETSRRTVCCLWIRCCEFVSQMLLFWMVDFCFTDVIFGWNFTFALTHQAPKRVASTHAGHDISGFSKRGLQSQWTFPPWKK